MRSRLLSIFIFTLVLIFPLAALAVPAGKFTHIEGRVDVTSPGKAAIPAKLGDVVNVGDIVRAKSKSKAEITLNDKSILRLAENSRLEISQFDLKEDQRAGIFNLFRGKVRNIVKSFAGTGKESRYEVKTKFAVCGVRGTDYFMFHQNGISGAVFKEGEGYFYNINTPEDVKTIKSGMLMLILAPDQPPVVKPATDVEIQKHINDTDPSAKTGEQGKKGGEGPIIVELESGDDTLTIYSDTSGGDTDNLPEIPFTETDTGALQEFQTTPEISLAVFPEQGSNLSTLYVTPNSSFSYKYQFDGGEWTSASGDVVIPEVGAGSHTFQWTATDSSGNTYSDTFNFDLNRYNLLGSAYGTGSVITGDVTDGDISAVYSDNWGGWSIEMGGTFTGTHGTSWEIFAGGRSYDSLTGWNGYWFLDINGTSGTSEFNCLTDATWGTGTGLIAGAFNDDGTWWTKAAGVGTYTESALAVSGKMPGGHFLEKGAGSDLPVFDYQSNILGFLGAKSSLWTGSPHVIAIGEFSNPNDCDLWKTDFHGQTQDGAKFYLKLAGISQELSEDWIEGWGNGIYIKPNNADPNQNQIGYVISNGPLTGNFYPGVNMWVAGGNLMAIPMGTTSILPQEIHSSVISSYASGSVSGSVNGSIGSEFSRIQGQQWGSWIGRLGGSYDPASPPPASWSALIEGGTDPQGELLDLNWQPGQGQVSVDGNTITMGSMSGQSPGVHGASALLPGGSSGYQISFDYNLWTDDSYSQEDGWWDSFSVSSSPVPYWQLSLTDPIYNQDNNPDIDVGFVWGGKYYTDAVTEFNSGSQTVELGSFGESTYLNVCLDTLTMPSADSAYPSWGTITVNTESNYQVATVIGTDWSDNTLRARAAGAWVSWSDGMSNVMGSKLVGTFNPEDSTWQGLIVGAWVETDQFLNMVNNKQNDALLALNIPCVEVGKDSLTGTNNNIDMHMNNVSFFAYSTGAAPRIWATNDVGGSYQNTPTLNEAVNLSGSQLNATFTVKNWADSTWGALVNGSGVLNRTDTGGTVNVNFTGGAAGTHTGAGPGDFNGTGAGVCK